MESSILARRLPLGGATEKDTKSRNLGLEMQQQQETEWCWAGVSTSVALFYEPESGYTQCAVVNAQLKQTTCCQDGASEACNQPWQLELALDYVGHLDRDFSERPTLPHIAEQVDAGKPVGLCINWTGGGGHFVVIDGYDETNGLIDVEDPWFGHSVVSYDSFPASYQGGGVWGWTYLTQK